MGIIITENSIAEDSESLQRNLKEQQYLNYIKNHIIHVIKAFTLYFEPLLQKENISTVFSDKDLKEAINICADNIKNHDSSKFGEEEFDAYRLRWYPTISEANNQDEEYRTIVEERYNDAWEHHYTNNRHHPKYWINKETGVTNDMELDAIIEMICDWESFSLINNSDTKVWYNTKAIDEKTAMTDRTKEIVEELLFNIIHS